MRLAMKPLTEHSTKETPRIAFCLNGDGIVTLVGNERKRTIYAVDAIDFSIVQHIPADSNVTGEDIVVLAYLSYLYCLRVGDTRMMRRLTRVPRDVVTNTRDNMFRSYDLVKYKIATLRCVIQQLTPDNMKQIEQHFVECGLKKIDAILYCMLYNNNDVQQFVSILQTIEDAKFSLDVNSLSRELAKNPKIKPEFEKAATYHCHKRISFIASANNMGFTAYRNDLVERAIQAYYWVRPFYSIPHAINYAKSACGGYALVILENNKKEDKARIKTDPFGNNYNIIQTITDDAYAVDNVYEEEDKIIAYIDEKRQYK